MNRKLDERLFESLVKIEKMYYIHDEDAQSVIIDDLYDDIDTKNWQSILDIPPNDVERAESRGYLKDFVSGLLLSKIIAEVHTPRMFPSDGDSMSWSWGHTTFTHLVAYSLEELVDKACKWADEMQKDMCKEVKNET